MVPKVFARWNRKRSLNIRADRLSLVSSIDTAANRCFCTEAVMQESSEIASIVHVRDWRKSL
jgi:hypothetical protein